MKGILLDGFLALANWIFVAMYLINGWNWTAMINVVAGVLCTITTIELIHRYSKNKVNTENNSRKN